MAATIFVVIIMSVIVAVFGAVFLCNHRNKPMFYRHNNSELASVARAEKREEKICQ